MASKFVVPLELPNLYGTPSSIADEGFVVCYIKDGWWTKKSPNGSELDLVLDRPLTGLSKLESTDEITQYDTVKSALEKLQQSILTLEITGGVQGTGYYTGGRFLLQTTIPDVTGLTCEDVATCPVITEIQSDISGINQTLSGLATVASTGSYNDLTDTPTIPTQVNADWNSETGASQILNKPSTFPPATHGHFISEIDSLQDTLDGINTYIGNVESSVPIYTTDLDDVSTTQPTDQQVLKFNSSSGVYEPSDMTVIGTLNDLSDVDTSTVPPVSGDALVFDGTNWVAGPVSGVPDGGNTGDILAKASATNGDVEWIENYTSSVKHTVKLAESINKGQVVYVSSADGTNMIVSKASNASEATSSKTMGLLAFTGNTNDQGFIITEGLLAGIDTSAANAAGDPVWLGTDGNLIFGLANKPSAPNHLVFIGIVTRKQQNNGEIFVKVQNGFEIKELHDVSAASPSNNDVLRYNSSNQLWEAAPVIVPAGMTWMGAFPG